LQFLQEQGLVTFVEQEGRKVYSITEEGRKFLIEHQDLEQEINERLTGWENPENIDAIRKTMFEYNKLGEALSWEIRKLDSKKLKRIREILSGASREIEEIIKE
jgi:DNA-binding PadR family transcriptional regulator